MAPEYEILTPDTILAYIDRTPRLDGIVDTSTLEVSEVGDGNLNLVFVCKDGNGDDICLKQSLPYVRLVGEGWPLTPERVIAESRGLAAAADHVPDLVPAYYGVDDDNYVIAMENLMGWDMWRIQLNEGNSHPGVGPSSAGTEPTSRSTEPMELDRVRVLSEGDDVTVFTAGITTEEAMRAAAPLTAAGVGMTHVHVSTHKPFTDPLILESIKRARHGVVTLENHTIIGGLGSAVAEVMAENAVGKRLVRLGLQDTFAHGSSRRHLMKEYGLDAPALVGGIEALLGKPTGVTEADLAAVRIEAVHSTAKAEAL